MPADFAHGRAAHREPSYPDFVRSSEMDHPVAAAVAVVVAVYLLLRTTAHAPSMLVASGVLVATYVQLHLLRSRTGVLAHPVTIVVCGINLGGLGGYFIFPMIASSAQVSSAIPHTPDVYNGAAWIFAVASISLWAGGMVPADPTSADSILRLA